MARMACVNVLDFSIQILLRNHPDWRRFPVVEVDRDKSWGRILRVNKSAQSKGLKVGMRFATALSTVNNLRSGVVSSRDVEKYTGAIFECLKQFSPDIESSKDEPGVFWLVADGLGRLYPSLKRWAEMIRADLLKIDFHAVIVVGFTRFSCYALAKSCRGVQVFASKEREHHALQFVPLECLEVVLSSGKPLTQLAIKTIGEFLRLPASGVLRRFGKDAYRIHQQATGKLVLPLVPDFEAEPFRLKMDFSEPLLTVSQLISILDKSLRDLFDQLRKKQERLVGLSISLYLENKEKLSFNVKPAEPTLDQALVLRLLSLRLVSIELCAGIVEIEIEGEGGVVSDEQLELIIQQPHRDLAAANQALAFVRSEFGDDTVLLAKLEDAHLPEGRFRWDLLDKVRLPNPRSVDILPLVRQVYTDPKKMGVTPTEEKRGHTCRRDPHYFAIISGPYIISSGWWEREIHREYHYAETQKGELLWVYYDCHQMRWFLQGKVV